MFLLLLHLSAHGRHAVHKLGAEQNVGIVELAFLEGHNDELKHEIITMAVSEEIQYHIFVVENFNSTVFSSVKMEFALFYLY
jgi:hypothetical protein